MDDRTSPYYPPRAGWNRHFYDAAYAVRRHLHLEELNLPKFAISITVWETFLCLVVPDSPLRTPDGNGSDAERCPFGLPLVSSS